MSDLTAEAHRRRLAADTLTVTGIVLASVLLVLVVYAASTAFLLVFAALLLAAIFCGIGHLLQHIGLPRWLSMIAVYLSALAAIVVPIAWGGIALVQEFNTLLDGVLNQVNRLGSMLGEMGLPIGGEDGQPLADNLQDLLPGSSGFVASAQKAIFGFLGAFGNVFVVVFLAIFISWQPHLYRAGVTNLFPRHKRARIGDVLDRSARSLILWVAGDAISMATIFVVSWAGLWAIGMPNTFLLALQAGLLAFIPTLGAFVAGVIIVLSALAVSPEMGLWALGVYILIQGIESNITTPIAQRYMTALPPALTLGFQILFGLLFGLLGFILAVPFLAVLKVLVDELYIEDVLGGADEPKDR